MKLLFDSILFCALFLITLSLQSFGDTPYELPKQFRKTEKWIKEENVRKSMANYVIASKDTTTISGALFMIRNEQKLSTFLALKSWCIRNYMVSFPHLVELLTDTTTVGLSNTNDLVIPGRTMRFDGQGSVVKEDLYRVCGRASFILNQLTGENFAVVSASTKYSEMERYQKLWRDWIYRLPR